MLFEAPQYHGHFSTAYSADGIHWREGAHNPRGPWLEPSGLTKWHGAYYVNGQARGQWSVQGEYGRTLVTYMSYDFENWSPAGSLGFRRDTLPPRPIPFFSEGQDDGEQVHLGASVWNRGNVIVGFYGMWHGSPTNDRRLVSVDIGLVVSHDALHYWEPIPDFRIVASRENVYAPGFPYVRAPSIAQGEGFENVGDETLFWYSSWGPFPGDGIRLARWERDRLGYLQMFGATEPALLVSAPIPTGGKPVAIELNAGGLGQWTSAKVSVLDEQMNVLPGYDAADCTGPSTAGLRQRVVWGSRDTVTAPGPAPASYRLCRGAPRGSSAVCDLRPADRIASRPFARPDEESRRPGFIACAPRPPSLRLFRSRGGRFQTAASGRTGRRLNFSMKIKVAFILPLLAAAAAAQVSVDSPDGSVSIAFSAPPDGPLTYTVSYRGRAVIDRSELGFEIEGQPPLQDRLRVLGSYRGVVDENYPMPHGKSNPVRNHCRTLGIQFAEMGPLGRKLTVEARAYDDGAAFRYILPRQTALSEVRITAERTQFNLAKEGTAYPLALANYQTMYEDDHLTLPLSGIRSDYLVGLPFLVELPGLAWVAITEADIDNYPGMYLVHSAERKNGRLLLARLAPSLEPGLAAQGVTPMSSPWRVVMVGDRPGRLVESNIVINLNPPSAIADTSWIRAGKTAWDWWSGSHAEEVNFKPGMNTATMEHYIDFAADSGFPYMLIDAGWSAGGGDTWHSGYDLLHTSPDIDMPEILRHAKSRKVGVWMWAIWSDIEAQADLCFPLFEQWGIAGVKIDFMSRDDQWMVNWYRRTLRQAAAHHLMIDFHGAYKPDGIRRTWPNLMTREG